MRFTGADISNGLLITIYYFATVLISAPGAAAAIFLGIKIGEPLGLMIGMLIFALWSLIIGTVCFILSKGVLHNCDMPVAKPRG